MSDGSESHRKALNILILIALAIAAVGSVCFTIFRDHLARFADTGF